MRSLPPAPLLLLLALTLAAPASAGNTTHRRYGAWNSTPIGGGGYLQQVHFCPTDPDRLYLTSDVGGFFRSDDRGRTWRMLHGQLPDDSGASYCRGLWVDPRDADRFLVAVDHGLYLSTDGGTHFERVLDQQFHGNSPSRNHGLILVASPDDPDLLLAAADRDGVFRSADGGRTWTRHGPQRSWFPSALAFDPAHPGRVWLAIGGWKDDDTRASGLWRSDDNGVGWQHVADTSPTEILPHPRHAGVLLGLIGQRPVRSDDGGVSWQPFDDGLPATGNGARDDGLYAAIAAHGELVALGGHGGHCYTLDLDEQRWTAVPRGAVDEGDWWGRMRPGLHQHFGSALGFLAINPRDPSHWLFTDWYALYQSHSAGRDWTLTIDGIEMTVTHGVTQDPHQHRLVHVGMADLGYFRSADAMTRARWVHEGITNNVRPLSASPVRRGRVYAVGPQEWQWHANAVFISDDAGLTWRRSPLTGLPSLEQRRVNTIVADAAAPDRVYVTVSGAVGADDGGVYCSDDGGTTWAALSVGLPEGRPLFRTNIWAHGPELAAARGGALVALSVDQKLAFRFDPAARRWHAVTLPGGGSVFGVFADPHHRARFYLCLQDGGLWRSDDGGAAWSRVLDRPAHWLAVDHAQRGRLALVSGADVLLSADDGGRWSVLDRALPYRHMRNQVAFAGDRVVVGTGGNGVFWSRLADAPPPSITGDAQPPVGPRAGPPGPASLLRNGGMEEGDATPAHWSLSDYREGQLTLARDTDVRQAGAAALRLQTTGRAAGFVHQALSPKPTGPFTVSGFVRAQGQIRQAQVALQVFDAQWKQVDWVVLAQAEPGKDWNRFERTVTLREGAAHALLGLSLSGEGTAWLDEVSASAAEAPAAAAPVAVAAPLPVTIPADDARLHYVGRFDRRDAKAPRATWSHTGLVVRFHGGALNVLVEGGPFQIVIDGRDAGTLATRGGQQRYRVADGLSDGEHTVALWKRTEPCFGVATFHGVELPDGARLLEPNPPPRRLELIGDSVATGHGNDGTQPTHPISAETQNAWLAYGAIAARMLDAEFTCIGWSGRKVWPNDTIGELYDLTIPQEKRAWDFTGPPPHAVVVALGANDFRQGPPEREGWTAAYVQLLERIRGRYPEARVFVASAPTLAGGWRTTLLEYLEQVVRARHDAGDANVTLLTFSEPPKPGVEGVGANYHPSQRTHRRLAEELAAAVGATMHWPTRPIDDVLQRHQPAAAELPQHVAPDDAKLRYVGRFAIDADGGRRCAWPASTLTFRLRAAAAAVRIADGGKNRIQVLIDGRPTQVIQLQPGAHDYPITGLDPARTHTVELVRATEALFGPLTFAGLRLSTNAALADPPVAARRIEFIGDSISAGYGNEAPDQTHPFSPATQNAALAYPARAARHLDAEAHVIAWSGKLLWPNNSIRDIYDRVLPPDAEPTWDAQAAGWRPDAIVINLGTNDFAGGNPQRDDWVAAYVDFLAALRNRQPQATFVLALGPMLSDAHSPSGNALTTIRDYLTEVVQRRHSAGDRRVRLVEFPTQRGEDGFGADWHPSLRTHQIMADQLTRALADELHWKPQRVTVDTDFPGGNAIVESIERDTIRLRPDLRDTATDWFYWAVRVRGAAGRTLHFHFTAQNPLADRGPALSLDGGATWRWLGRTDGRRDRFTVTFPADADEALLSFGMVYTRRHWDAFLDALPRTAPVERGKLADTRKGREVPTLRLGRLDGAATHRVLLTARTHACEMMASYVVEGFITAALADGELGRWFRDHAEVLVVPFMDTDGVEDGDQGKNRRPRDHNRDLDPPHVHVETAALVERGRRFFDGRPAAAIDLHCPWIYGGFNEQVFQVGREDPARWQMQQRFAAAVRDARTGPLYYGPELDMPFGTDFNTNANSTAGRTTSGWTATQPGVLLATSIEIPYATASGAEMNPANARALGRDLAAGLRALLQDRPTARASTP